MFRAITLLIFGCHLVLGQGPSVKITTASTTTTNSNSMAASISPTVKTSTVNSTTTAGSTPSESSKTTAVSTSSTVNTTTSTSPSSIHTTTSSVPLTSLRTTFLPNINATCVPTTKHCVYNGTNTICDPCHNFLCPSVAKCVSNTGNCTPTCVCINELQHLKDGKCVSVCDPDPCHGSTCTPTLDNPKKYICRCKKHFTGELCEEWFNYCLDPPPEHCPKGPFNCNMTGPGNYSCACADGYHHDVTDNICLKIGQQLEISLIFVNSFYDERYNHYDSPFFINASLAINKTLSDIYKKLLVGLEYGRFSEGSLVANFSVRLRVPESGFPEDNVNNFKKYLVNCESREWKANLSKICFGQLGQAFLPINGIRSQDLRCLGEFCPRNTICSFSTLPSLRTSNPRCICDSGFNTTGVVTDHLGRLIDTCEDINECVLNSSTCTNATVCHNTFGGFECITTPCVTNPCPGNAVCVSDSANFYTCECSWIYSADGCESPWPVVTLILSILFVVTVLSLIAFMVVRSMRNSTGTSVFCGR